MRSRNIYTRRRSISFVSGCSAVIQSVERRVAVTSGWTRFGGAEMVAESHGGRRCFYFLPEEPRNRSHRQRDDTTHTHTHTVTTDYKLERESFSDPTL